MMDLKLENDRIVGLEAYCKTAKKDIEAFKF